MIVALVAVAVAHPQSPTNGEPLGVVQGTQSAFWCPMHPNERSPVATACPICKMPMVPIPPLRIGEYLMDVSQVPARNGALAGLRVTIRDPTTKTAVVSLNPVHERPMHLFVVSRSLEYFAHLHPQASKDGAFEVRQSLPAGEYMVVADFLPTGGSPQTLQRYIVTPGVTATSSGDAHLTIGPADSVAGGAKVTLGVDEGPLVAGRNSHMRFVFADAATGRPITDFEPYLGAAAHLFIASADLTETTHVHPDDTAVKGATIVFDVTPPKTGLYKMWLQFQRRGSVVTVPFVVNVGIL
jgi:Heavy metal binding domain